MGSLMAGWNSPIHSYKPGSFGRSASFTKYEIEDFRNKQRVAEEEHLKAASLVAEEIRRAQQQDVKVEAAKVTTVDADGHLHTSVVSVEEELDKNNSFKDWWTKSSWAFLNENAMKRMDPANYKYKAQFAVAIPSSPPKSH